MTQQLTLQEIQSMSLKIVKEVHAFCIENNIRYTLAYGSLIGAIRHKGFIPWDDDMDILMPRPDYDRFCKTFKGRTTKVIYPEAGNCYLNFARVCDMVETEVEPHTAWATEQTGVWIDLFPIDGISDNRDEFITRANEIRSVENKLFEARGKKDKISRNRSFMFNLKKIAKKIVFRGYDIKALQEQYYNLLPITDFETSKNCGMLRFPNAIEKEFIPTYIYKDYILTDFCDTQLMVIKRYDEFLRYFYGDYMKYPPIEQRQPLHSDHLYFWKKKNQ